MLKVKIIAIGSLKEEYLRAAVAEYKTRLGAYCELTLCELKETKLPDRPSDAEISAALAAEATKLIRLHGGDVATEHANLTCVGQIESRAQIDKGAFT